MSNIHIQGTTARLRRTFHYPNDSDSDSQPEAIDEEEQDRLITLLASENASRNAQFARTLILLPLLSTIAYVRPLLLPRRPSSALFALLGVTSLLATAFLLYRLPPTETGIAPLDAWASRSRRPPPPPPSRAAAAAAAAAALRHPQLGGMLPSAGGGASPLEKYLPYMNLGLALVLILMGLAKGGGDGSAGGGFGWVTMGNLPGLVYSISLTAKVVMAGVDPERDLSGLRYDFKGA